MMSGNRIDRVILITLDSVGVGELPDADEYGDCGSNTLRNIADELKGLKLPNLESMGLGCIQDIQGFTVPGSGLFGLVSCRHP